MPSQTAIPWPFGVPRAQRGATPASVAPPPAPEATDSTPGWVTGYVPPADEWNGLWAGKVDVNNGELNDPTITNGTLTNPTTEGGTFNNSTINNFTIGGAGGPTFTSGVGPPTSVQPVASIYLNTVGAPGARLYISQGDGTWEQELPLTGGALTGPLMLAADPTTSLGAATKEYVDASVGGKLPLTGGALTGPLMLAADPTTSLGAATKEYVDASVGGKLSEAPTDGSAYGRLMAAWSPVLPATMLGTASGVASLDATGRVPTAQLPPSATGTLAYKGGWNAATNTPVMASGALAGGVLQPAGNYYVVTVGATTAAIDGTTTWVAGDWIASTGTIWQRVQNSTSPYLPLTGGTLSGPLATPNYALTGSDAWQGTIGLPYVWQVQDAAGNISVALDSTGTLNVAALNIPTGFSAATATIGTLTAGGDVVAVQPPTPDLIRPIMDASGNIIAAFSGDGTLNLVSLNVGGQPVRGAASGTSDSIDVRNPTYGAVGDAVESHGYVTTSGTALSLVNFTGTVTLAQLTTTTAQLTIVGAAQSGWAFQPYHAGKSLYLTVSGYTLQATVASYLDGQNLVLNASGITAQSSVAGTVTCPAFTSAAVGKLLVIEGMGQGTWWTGAVHQADTVTTYPTQTFATTIAAVTAPNAITATKAFPFAVTSQPMHTLWGTNDGNAVAQAAQAAFAAGKRKLYFSGDGALYLLAGMCDGGGGRPGYVPVIGTDPSALFNGVIWIGDNARAYTIDGGATPIRKQVAQAGVNGSREARRGVFGRASMPRCNRLTTINVLFCGDSQGLSNPQNQGAAWQMAHTFIAEFRRANPGKTINFYDIAVGGGTWAHMADPTFVVSEAGGPTGPTYQWVVPRPITGTTVYSDFITNVNRSPSGGPIVPDLVYIAQNGGNDGPAIDPAAIAYIINKIRAIPHADGFGPTDIIMKTCENGAIGINNIANGGGVLVPGAAQHGFFAEYSVGLHRSIAQVRGFGCFDEASVMQRAVLGLDMSRRAMRTVPSITVTPTPTVPYTWGFECRDFATWFTLPGANDAAVWSVLGQLDFQISQNHGNRVMLRLGANGNIWLGVSTYGGTVPTTCTISNGGTDLVVGAPLALSNQTFGTHQLWPQLFFSTSTPFTPAMQGQTIVGPMGDQGGATNQLQRTFIRTVLDSADLLMTEFAAVAADQVAQTGGNFTVGGAQFIPQDTTSQPDVVIFYPDGTIFNTQVVAYVSNTEATLATPAPEALSGAAVPVFIGRMGVKWLDTGFAPSTTGTFNWVIEVTRDMLMLGYSTATHMMMSVDMPIERYGAPFCPMIWPAATQQIAMTNSWIDVDQPYMPSATPWEVRGLADPNSDYYLGGVGGHPASRIRTEVFDPLFCSQDLSTW